MPSDLVRMSINAQETSEIFLALLSFTHPQILTPMNFVNDLQNVVSNGTTYVAWPFDLPFPSLGEDTLPTLTLTIDNVDRSIWNALSGISTPIDVQLSYVLRSNPDSVEGGPLFLRMRTTEVNMTTISGSLMFEDLLNEPFPLETYSPALAPGLF